MNKPATLPKEEPSGSLTSHAVEEKAKRGADSGSAPGSMHCMDECTGEVCMGCAGAVWRMVLCSFQNEGWREISCKENQKK
jgi:hypothetical protein